MGETIQLRVGPMEAIAPTMEADLSDVVAPEYGHYLEDFVPGTVFLHPRGITLDRGAMLAYATTFMEANPLYLNEAFARTQGYECLPAAPHMVMNLALSLGVQNDSEKAIANLGYYDVRFLCPVHAGDTLMGRTRVVARRDRGVGKPGIVTVETLAINQHGAVVVQYRRKIFVPRRGEGDIDGAEARESTIPFPYEQMPTVNLPAPGATAVGMEGVVSTDTLAGAFRPGQIIVHRNGRTITDEHVQWTYRVMNTHPLHYDRLYSTSREGIMSGEPIVYGGLVFGWLLGLASRDVTENAVWELGYHDGYHTQPTFAGDTVAAITRICDVSEADAPGIDAMRIRMQLIGVKNISAPDALARYGQALFMRENDKKRAGMEKIPEKIFEIERDVLERAQVP